MLGEARLAQDVAPAPDRFYHVISSERLGQFLAQLADEDVDDLQFRFVHAAVKVVQEHFLGQRRALAQAEQFQDLVFLAGQVDRLAFYLDRMRVQIDDNVSDLDQGLAVALGPCG